MNDSRDALEQACATAGIDAGGARLLRVGSNAVYRLKAPVIVRISRPGADASQVRRTVAVARWLESVSYPAVRAVDVDQPVAVDGHLVTFWEAVSDDGDQYASTAEVAEVLVKLHALTAPADPAQVAQAMPEFGCQLGLVEIPYPARIIFRPAPLELPYCLGQCPVTLFASPSRASARASMVWK